MKKKEKKLPETLFRWLSFLATFARLLMLALLVFFSVECVFQRGDVDETIINVFRQPALSLDGKSEVWNT